MERNANYALVGLISTALLIAAVVFVMWLTGPAFNKAFNLYDIVFQGPVRGLSKGAEVHFNGIKVGEVVDIFLDKSDSRLVIARATITADVPVRADSYATLEPLGITGVNYVQITAGTGAKPLLKDTVPEGQIPRMASRRDALSDLLEGGGSVLQKTLVALGQVNKVLSDRNIKSISSTMTNVEAVTAELRQRKSIIADAQKTIQSANEAVLQIRDLAKTSQGLVSGDGRRTMVKLADAASEIEATVKQTRGMIASLQTPTSEFAANGLPQLTEAIASLRRATDNLDHMVSEVRANPRGLLGKAPAREIEVKP
jgi:phospholipid/cholesterol/gamma-HCH transport system substrate-binding protein